MVNEAKEFLNDIISTIRLQCRLIKRSIKHWFQRRIRGFDDRVTWSLDHEFAVWILPRLKHYHNIASEYIVIDDEFEKAIQLMIRGFEAKVNEFDRDDYEQLELEIEQGMQAFATHWQRLWW